jgi:UDP-N-acetylglucosamine:LPS N-acetylglucosamine transferase
MPMKAIVETFQKKYGDKVEVISSNFYTETSDKHLIRYEKMLTNQVRLYNISPHIGYLVTFANSLFGATLSNWGSVKLVGPISCKRAIEHMEELKPDVVFSTHWSPNYYAENMKNKPLTVLFCPDARLSKLYFYRSDLALISMPHGYHIALRHKRFNLNNLKLVPFLIRNEAFEIFKTDKKELRMRLGIPVDNFTIILAEGGYGIGKIESMSKLLVKEKIPLTVIAICGTNKGLYKRLKSLQSTEYVTLLPMGFSDRILEYEAASDIFCGKSGNILAESTFFGVPSIATHFANKIEENIADHYINTVGCTIKEFSPKKAVRMIHHFATDDRLLEPYRTAALNYHEHFGAEQAADELWKKIVEKYPDIK